MLDRSKGKGVRETVEKIGSKVEKISVERINVAVADGGKFTKRTVE